MWDLTCTLLLLSLAASYSFTVPASQPHIIFILADDMGWNDVSFHGSDQIPTPNIDALGYHGVILNRHYAQPVCTPSRTSLMTGKYPLHTGIHVPLASNHRTGLDLSEKILPEYLKEVGYETHIIGKWHLGFYKKSLTPLQRGFHSHLGYWSGVISYYDHICQDSKPVPPYNYTFSGHDLRRDYAPALDVVGEYATDLFTREAVRIIEKHPLDKPMFMYLPHLAVHTGNKGKFLEAPQEVINRFGYIADPNRRTYAAMVSKLDESVGAVIKALSKKSMLENSIVVFLSDNGAPNHGLYPNWGSNYPFRGQKETLWEGGVRTPAVVWSPLIKNPSRVSNNLMHITDWLPTLLAAAGYKSNNLRIIDGINQWQAISNGAASPRDHVLVDIDSKNNMRALVVNRFKYIKGPSLSNAGPKINSFSNFHSIISSAEPKYSVQELIKSPAWQALQKYSTDTNLQSKVKKLRQDSTVTCDHDFTRDPSCTSDTPCLFNILDDPCEQNNIANLYPRLMYCIEKLLETYERTSVPDTPLINDPASNPEFFNGTWSIWVS